MFDIMFLTFVIFVDSFFIYVLFHILDIDKLSDLFFLIFCMSGFCLAVELIMILYTLAMRLKDIIGG